MLYTGLVSIPMVAGLPPAERIGTEDLPLAGLLPVIHGQWPAVACELTEMGRLAASWAQGLGDGEGQTAGTGSSARGEGCG